MTKKTSVKKFKRGDSSGVGSLTLAFVAFVFGYLIATIFDINQMHTWVNNKMQTQSSIKAQAKAERQQTKPKLEFYTLLAQNNHKQGVQANKNYAEPEPPKNLKSTTKVLPVPGSLASKDSATPNAKSDKVNVASVPNLVATSNLAKTSNLTGAANISKYVLQVGSFKSKVEAERMRAALVMKGFDVNIATATKQNENWFRVIVGPVVSLKEAESLRSNLASRERINGMIRKIDA